MTTSSVLASRLQCVQIHLRAYIHRTTSQYGKSGKKLHLKGRPVGEQQWLLRQHRDPYVKQAQLENYRCRSAFKLLEIDDKHAILKPGQVIVDCGAAPGSWTQIAVKRIGTSLAQGQSGEQYQHARVIAVDMQSITPIDGATILPNYDLRQLSTQQKILNMLDGQRVDVVLSDMAPNASGMKSLDHENIIDLCLVGLKFSAAVLKDGGTYLCKLWQGGRQPELQEFMQQCFNTVKVIKPKASRTESAEIYMLGRNFTHPLKRNVTQL